MSAFVVPGSRWITRSSRATHIPDLVRVLAVYRGFALLVDEATREQRLESCAVVESWSRRSPALERLRAVQMGAVA